MSTIGISGKNAAFQGKSTGVDFLTPPSLLVALGALRETADGYKLGAEPFDLDPTASVRMPWPTARTMWTTFEDGAAQDWSPYGDVWANFPYGKELYSWLARLAAHGNGLALLYARTDTIGFKSHIWDRASALYFFEGRLHFHKPITGHQLPQNSGGPMCLVAYGAKSVARLKRLRGSEYPGTVVHLKRGGK